MTATHPRHHLDDLVHQPVRFSLLATLAAEAEAAFAFVRDAIEVSDSVLSKHAATLESAGYLPVRKGHVGKRPRTWFRLTDEGRSAFEAHVALLRETAAGGPLTDAAGGHPPVTVG